MRGKPPAPRDKAGELTDPRQFNLMSRPHGPVRETPPWPTCDRRPPRGFLSVPQRAPVGARVPFGIAQIGKAYRNEITPGHFIFRTREFERWRSSTLSPGTRPKHRLQSLDGAADACGTGSGTAPRACACGSTDATNCPTTPGDVDIEYRFPIGWAELEGIANRGDYDLSRHAEFSGEKLEYFDQDAVARPTSRT